MPAQQRFVRLLLDHPALVEHHDVVRLADGGQVVCNYQHRAPSTDALDGLLDEALGLRVEAARGECTLLLRSSIRGFR